MCLKNTDQTSGRRTCGRPRRHAAIARSVPLLVLLLTLPGCGSEVTEPGRHGYLRVTVESSGVDIDEDGYQLIFGTRPPLRVGATDTVFVDGLPRGTVSIAFEDVAINCSLNGPNPLELSMEPIGPTFLDLLVTCIPNEGDLQIELEVIGPVEDPSGFEVRIDDQSRPVEGRSASLLFESLRGGEKDVVLDDLASYCGTEEPSTVLVLPGTITTVEVSIRCDYSVRGRILFSALVDEYRLYTAEPDGTDVVPFGDHSMVSGDQLRSSISRDGSRIVFWYDRRDIWTIDGDGTNMRPVPNGALAATPSISPDGERIAFSRSRDIWVMGFDGSNPTQITSETGFANSPSWSPDGERIAFELEREAGGWDVYTIGADGSDLVQVTSIDLFQDNLDPAYSPDGARLAFYANTNIVTSDPDGSNVEGLVSLGWDPSWSPDGKWIAFHRDWPPVGAYVVEVETGTVTSLTAASLPGVSAVHTFWGPPR